MAQFAAALDLVEARLLPHAPTHGRRIYSLREIKRAEMPECSESGVDPGEAPCNCDNGDGECIAPLKAAVSYELAPKPTSTHSRGT